MHHMPSQSNQIVSYMRVPWRLRYSNTIPSATIRAHKADSHSSNQRGIPEWKVLLLSSVTWHDTGLQAKVRIFLLDSHTSVSKTG